jgi:hypothetical protein
MAAFRDNIFDLKPDRLSCFGAAAADIERTVKEARDVKAPEFAHHGREPRSPKYRALWAVANILERHFPPEDDLKIGRVDYDPLLPGVRIQPSGAGPDVKADLTVGLKFLERITGASFERPGTLLVPVEELERAIRKVDAWREGNESPQVVYLSTLP